MLWKIKSVKTSMDEWKQNQQAEEQQHDRTWAHRMHSINNNVCSSTLCLLLLWLYSFYHNFRSTAKEKRYACLFALNRIVVACTMVVCLHILSNHNQCTNCWKQKKTQYSRHEWQENDRNSIEQSQKKLFGNFNRPGSSVIVLWIM